MKKVILSICIAIAIMTAIPQKASAYIAWSYDIVEMYSHLDDMGHPELVTRTRHYNVDQWGTVTLGYTTYSYN